MKCPNCNIDLRGPKEREECLQCGFLHFPGTKPITEMYVWTTVDQNGNEGILTVGDPSTKSNMVPLAFSDYKNVELTRSLVENLAKKSIVKIKLLKFSGREVLEEHG